MSDTSSSSSPDSSFEQGEVKSSPEHYVPTKKRERSVIISSKERHVSLSPHPQESLEEKEHMDIIEIPSDDGEIERDALNIKPPQSQAGPMHREKSSRKRKHKGERRREKQKHGHEKDRERDRYRHINDPHPRGERSEGKERTVVRGFKDAREIVRERQKEKEKRQKEAIRDDWEIRDDRDNGKEARKRKESLKERERLENMEREKQRERRLREERERADKQRRKEEERRLMQRGEDSRPREKGSRNDRHNERNIDRKFSRQDRDRGRSNKEQRRQKIERDRSDVRDRDRSYKDDEDRSRSRGSRIMNEDSHSDHREELKRPVHLDHTEEDEEEDLEVPEEPPSPRGNQLSDDSDDDEPPVRTPQQQTSSSGGESDSDRESTSSTGKSEDRDNKAGHLKSKFENESEDEAPVRRKERSLSVSAESDDEDDLEHVGDETPGTPEGAKWEELPLYLPAIQGCRSVEEFNCLNRIEEGTYGVVYRATDRKTGEVVALKRLKMEKEKEGFPITSLREINTLLKAQHTNIVTVREIVIGSNMDKIYIVMDYVEHDIKTLMEAIKTSFSIGEVKTLMIQLLRAVAHLHDNWILHRDLKTSNLLLSHKGILKVGDFGLAREYGSPLKQYTPIVVTLWYRAPELLMGTKEYSKPVDIWSVGCIFAEFLTMKPLWPGKTEQGQLEKIFKDLGTPTLDIWPGMANLPVYKDTTLPSHTGLKLRDRFSSVVFSDLGFDLMIKLLTYDPEKRITASEALEHKWFTESPKPTDPSMFPTWPARSEGKVRAHASSPRPPTGGKGYSLMVDDELKLAAGFHMDTAAKGVSAKGPGFQLKF